MGIFKSKAPKSKSKRSIKLFDQDVSLRFINGKISHYEIETWTRCFDKDNNLTRHGEAAEVFREEKYNMLELSLDCLASDGYMRAGHDSGTVTLHFERDQIFESFKLGQTISYYGLFITEGASWINYFIYNHDLKARTALFPTSAINRDFFKNKFTESELEEELSKGMFEKGLIESA